MADIEIRTTSESWPDADMEIRATGNGLNFIGYAAVFDSDSEDLGGFRERIAPGAFAQSLRRRRHQPKMFLNHDSNLVLASKQGGTLRLSEDSRGLIADADLPDNEWGRPVRDAVERGDINAMSFGFHVEPGGDAWSGDRKERTLTSVYLHEVSPVTAWPAYSATSASMRTLANVLDVEVEPLRDAYTVLFAEDGELTPDQRDLLLRAIEARTPAPTLSDEDREFLERISKRRFN